MSALLAFSCNFFCMTSATPLIPRAASASDTLANFALQKVLDDAAPIFGNYNNKQTNTSTWMKAYPDNTPIVHMNIPGTHDSATWNYSQAAQDSLLHITNLDGLPQYPAEIFRCQDKSLIAQLNAGIRVFDLRPAFDPLNSTLVFWHSKGCSPRLPPSMTCSLASTSS